MITWLASYPRSGNTFARIILDRVFGISTQSIYHNNDGVVNMLGQEFVGAGRKTEELLSIEQLSESSKNWILKTHNMAVDDHPAIYIVRDGRDSLVSFAHLELRDTKCDDPIEWNQLFEEKMVELMNRKSNAGNWGDNVCSWLDRINAAKQPHHLVRYEDLIENPIAEMQAALNKVGYPCQIRSDSTVPEFKDLQGKNPQFFRKGITGGYIAEMPETIQALFWSKPEMKRAMSELGY